MSQVVDAVSIVITCGDEIFAIQRQNYLAAFPGYWAFPGGKVEKEDAEFASGHDLCQNIDLRLFGAVVREGTEELGINLHDEIQKGNVRSVDYLGLAVTPDFNPYRFATYFFKIDLVQKIDFMVDANEASFAEWMSSERLLKMYNEGKILAVPPVIKVIETLGKQPDVKHIENLITTYDNTKYVPYIENLKGMRQIMPLSHTLPPAIRTNAFLIGDEVRLIVDPSPQSDEEYEKFKNTVALWGAHKIFITHHHPDHYERANLYAREMNLPMLISRDTHMRITRSQPSFFDGVQVEFVKEGDVVTQWLGNDVLVMEIPGHDEGQIALYSKDLSWYLAGDLFQGIGTVVIGGEEGDMRKYFATLERIIKLSPKVLFPSHGIGLGGTAILEKTLAHRKQRESQILNLHLEGLAPEQMLEKIYAEVNKNLWPYALENIHKHLAKLKQDKVI